MKVKHLDLISKAWGGINAGASFAQSFDAGGDGAVFADNLAMGLCEPGNAGCSCGLQDE
jgi:hypothetical protein